MESEALTADEFNSVVSAVTNAFGDPTPHAELQQLEPSAAQRDLIVALPKPGTNRVIVTHHFIIERYAPGIRPGTVISALKALAAGLGTQQQFDCAPYTPQAVGSPTAPFGFHSRS